MGSFRQHVIGGSIAGIACSFCGYTAFQLDIIDASAAGMLCAIGSILPDLDSPSSKPTEITVGLLSIISPVLLLQSIGLAGLRPSEVLVYGLGSHFGIRWILRKFLKKITVHRGIIHSIPVAIIWGTIIFISFRATSPIIQNYLASSALIGFVVHLLIDELWSYINFDGGFMPARSFGTALKFSSESGFSTTLAYAVLFALLWFTMFALPSSK